MLGDCREIVTEIYRKVIYLNIYEQLKKTRGRPKTKYIQVIQTQLNEKHIQTLEDAMI